MTALLCLPLLAWGQTRAVIRPSVPGFGVPAVVVQGISGVSLSRFSVLPFSLPMPLAAPALESSIPSAAVLPVGAVLPPAISVEPVFAEESASVEVPQAPPSDAAAGKLGAAAADIEDRLTASDAVFDGRARKNAQGVFVPSGEDQLVRVPGLPAFLSVADAADRAWITGVLAKALTTRTGRQVLRRAAAVASRRGLPIPVQIEDLRTENGSFVYDWDVLQLARSLVRQDSDEAAPILVHELLHFVQRDIGLPSDSLEMELEAHIVTLQVFRELGLRPDSSTFSRQFEKALVRGGPQGAVRWLKEQYKTNIGILGGKGLAGYVSELEGRRKSILRRIKAAEKLLAKHTEMLAMMRDSAFPPEALASYEADQLDSVRVRLRDIGKQLFWADHDLALLGTPRGAEAYRAFAQRVAKRIERYHRLLKRSLSE